VPEVVISVIPGCAAAAKLPVRKERGEQAEESTLHNAVESIARPLSTCKVFTRALGQAQRGGKSAWCSGLLDRCWLARGPRARWIIPGDPPGGVLTDVFVGIVGAAIGAWLYGPLRHVDVKRLQPSESGLRVHRRGRSPLPASYVSQRSTLRLKGATVRRWKRNAYDLHHHRAVHRTKDKSCVDVCSRRLHPR